MPRSLAIPMALFALSSPLAAQDDVTAAPNSRAGQRQEALELFDGKSLDGWVTSGGRYDGKALWTVEEGAITGRQGPNKEGGLIYTDRFWHSFDLELETKIDYPFDSGVFVRMVPRGWKDERGGKGLQVTLDHRPGGEVGGIYADGWLHHCPDGEAQFPKNEWNHVRVRLTGHDMRVQVWLNGKAVTDYQIPPGTPGYAPSGRIGLQVHGGRDDPPERKAQFKNIRITELPVVDGKTFSIDANGFVAATDAAKEAGWKDLLESGFSGWEPHGDGRGYAIRDRVMHFLTKGGSPHIVTKEDYEDFLLRFEFKTGKMANSGLFLRAARDGSNPAFSGCEIQILDDFNWEAVTNSKLKDYQFTGGLYGSVPAGIKDALYPLGRWNTYEIKYEGVRLSCRLNGELLWDVNTLEVPGKSFAERAPKGFIGLQRHAPGGLDAEAYAWFKNIWIRPLNVSDGGGE